MSASLPQASLLENVRFNATVIVPNAAQGLFRRRRAAVAAATAAGVDGQAVGLLGALSRKHDGGPVWVRILTERALLVLDPADVERVLEGAPAPFASDPKPKRDGMVAFQPEAATISRGDRWQSRRRFIDAVLKSPSGEEKLLVGWQEACLEEFERMLSGPVAIAGGELHWDAFHETLQRIARRLILGDRAADDDRLTELLEQLMSEGNGMPGEPSEDLHELESLIAKHVDEAERGSLAGRFAGAPRDDRTDPIGQVPHWLFALGDTLAINALRALAVLASDSGQLANARASEEHLAACLQEAMRLWPTTTTLSRETTEDVEWGEETIPAGTQVVIVNSYGHRDRDRLDYADRFAPEEWIDGDAAAYPGFNFFSRGPQVCPGTAIATGVGELLLAELIERFDPEALSPKLDLSKPLPHMIDFFSIRVRLAPRD
jgi:cytochrome P450